MISDSLHALGCELATVETAGVDRLRKLRAVISLLIAVRKSDVLWIAHPRLAPVGALIAGCLRKPYIVSTYGFENWERYSLLTKAALRQADAVTVLSRFSEAMLCVSTRRTIILRPFSTLAEGAGKNWDAPQGDRRGVLFVGRLDEPYKGLDLVEALGREIAADTTVTAAGWSGEQDHHIHSAAVTVVADPSTARLTQLYGESSIVVLPSSTRRTHRGKWVGGEGFGIVLLEAASAGCVTVASDQGACPETVALLGNGVVCEPVLEKFAAEILALLRDLPTREHMATVGRARSTRFDRLTFCQVVQSVLAATQRRRDQTIRAADD